MIERKENDHYLTIKELTRQLCVCRAWVYLWLKKGFPQPYKFGRASRWSALEVEEWLRSRPKGVYGEQGNE